MSTWRDKAACTSFPGMFFDRELRHQALHLCRYHCPVAMSCNAEFRRQYNVGVVVGGRAYGTSGELLLKTEQAREVRACNTYCRAVESARQQKEA